jgi:hypothetical protein
MAKTHKGKTAIFMDKHGHVIVVKDGDKYVDRYQLVSDRGDETSLVLAFTKSTHGQPNGSRYTDKSWVAFGGYFNQVLDRVLARNKGDK